jgi:3-dehydroquinate synthase
LKTYLPDAIDAKWRVIQKDPYEKKGDRQVLNLGHTMGHALEAEFKLPHGVAVALGLEFALKWSFGRGELPKGDFDRIQAVLALLPQKESFQNFCISEKRLRELLSQDKKRRGSEEVVFIFIQGIGKAIREAVHVDDVVEEANRQGWLEK